MSMNEFGEEALRIVEDGLFVVRDAGPLHTPIWKIEVRRDEKLALVVETEAPGTAASTVVELPSGTVQMSTQNVELGNPAGVEALLEGVIGYSVKVAHDSRGDGTLSILQRNEELTPETHWIDILLSREPLRR
jgi:hypothetical protein